MSTLKQKPIIEFLKETLEKFERLYSYKTDEKDKDFRIFIIQDLLDAGEDDDVLTYLEDICNFGTHNGTPSYLIYTNEINKLFEKYSLSIIYLLTLAVDEGEPITINREGEYPSDLIHYACKYYCCMLLQSYEHENKLTSDYGDFDPTNCE